MTNFPFHTWLTGTTKRMTTNHLEVLRNIVHLLPFQVGDNDIDIITT